MVMLIIIIAQNAIQIITQKLIIDKNVIMRKLRDIFYSVIFIKIVILLVNIVMVLVMNMSIIAQNAFQIMNI